MKGSSTIIVLGFAAVALLVISVAYFVTKPTPPLNSNAASGGNKYGLSKAPAQAHGLSITPKPSGIENETELDQTEQDLDNTDINQTDTEVTQVSTSL